MVNRLKRIFRYRMQNMQAIFDYGKLAKYFIAKEDLVLLFHGIDQYGSQRLNLRFTAAEDFLFIINFLQKYYTLSSLDDLILNQNDKPRLAVTFDDGYKNWITHLFPLLEKKRIPATFFITTHHKPFLWTDQYDIFRCFYHHPIEISGQRFRKVQGFYRADNGMELNRFLKQSGSEVIAEFQDQAQIEMHVLKKTKTYWELLNDEEISLLGMSPLITIGSHGCTHASFNTLNDQDLENELNNSKRKLEQLIGKSLNAVSFPSGKYDQRVLDFSRHAGYTILLAEAYAHPGLDRQQGDLFERKGIYSTGSKHHQLTKLLKTL